MTVEQQTLLAADLALVRRTIGRDPAALRAFAERIACCACYIRRTASRQGFQISDAVVDDIAQETYLALWRKLEEYDGLTRLESWACGFASIEFLRWRSRAMRSRETPEEELEDVAPPVDPFVVDDTGEAVVRVLDEMGPPASTIIRLKCFDDLTFEAIAARLRLSANTVKSHYYRGLARLRGLVGHHEDAIQ